MNKVSVCPLRESDSMTNRRKGRGGGREEGEAGWVGEKSRRGEERQALKGMLGRPLKRMSRLPDIKWHGNSHIPEFNRVW